MILLEEKTTKKVPGETSLFVTFDFNPIYVDLVKSCAGSNYDKKTKTWEVPSVYLSKILDGLTLYDSIELKLLKDERKTDSIDNSYKLIKHEYQPFDYQEEGIRYGLSHDKWLLLDAPGLGKSAQAIYLAEELKKRDKISHCLIVCGVNTLKENWRKEILKFSKLSCTILGEKISKTGKRSIGLVKERLAQLKRPIKEFFVITNIETLRQKDIVEAINKGPNTFDLIVIDEIHRVKDPTSQAGKGVLNLNKSKYKVGATGTLIMNNPLDAYVPLKWIGVENSTYTNFKYFYCNFGGPFRNILCGFKNTEVLKEMIEKHSLRRTKDILNLPPKTIINEYVEMEDAQHAFYENIKKGVKEQVDKVKLSTASMLALLIRLRQATACPSILTTEKIPSAKIDRACDLVEEIVGNGESVVVFSTFKETVVELQKRLEKYNPLIGTGDIKDDIISQNVDIFQKDPDRKVFIGTWQKMGTGLTLTKASYEIFIDVPYTNAAYVQAQDRCYRIGTNRNVTIYHLITEGTVDERVLEIVEDKEALSDFIVDDKISAKGLKSLQKYIEELE